VIAGNSDLANVMLVSRDRGRDLVHCVCRDAFANSATQITFNLNIVPMGGDAEPIVPGGVAHHGDCRGEDVDNGHMGRTCKARRDVIVAG
jgi:hypothetical protein